MTNTVARSFSEIDTEAFTAIYNRYWHALFKNILRIIFQEEIAEDILHDVFFKFWENRHKFNDDQSIASWLFTVSYNMSITHIRRLVKEKKYISVQLPKSLGENLSQPQEACFEDLKVDILHEVVRLLPDRKKQVFELCKFQGKSYAEAAALLGISPNTVKEYMTASVKFVKNQVLEKYAAESIITIYLLGLYLQN